MDVEKIGEIGDSGYLRIDNEADRNTVATILFNNGYTVSKTRKKRNGKTFVYFVRYELKSVEIEENEGGE